MDLLNVAAENHDYDSLNENSSDLERLDVFFAILIKPYYGEYVYTWKLKLKPNQQSYFEALLLETGFVFDDSSETEQRRFKLTSKATILLNQHGSYLNYLSSIERQKLKSMTETEKMNLLLNQLNTKPPGVCHQLDELQKATGLDLITIEILCKKIDAKGDCSFHQHCTSISTQGVYTSNNRGYQDEPSFGSTHYHGSVLQVGRDLNAPTVQDSSLVDSDITHKVKIIPNKKEAIARQSGLSKFINNPIVKWIGGILTGLLIAYLIYYLGWN